MLHLNDFDGHGFTLHSSSGDAIIHFQFLESTKMQCIVTLKRHGQQPKYQYAIAHLEYMCGSIKNTLKTSIAARRVACQHGLKQPNVGIV